MRRVWLTLAVCLAAAPAAAQRVVVDNQAQHVVVDSCAGCGGAGTSFLDGASFTAAVDAILNVGGVFNDGLSDLTAGKAGAVRITKQRALHANLRDALGNETGTSLAPFYVAPGLSVSFAVTGTFWQATQPISAASLPLPAGAATSAKQPALGVAGTAAADVLTVQGIASMTALKVDGSAVTQPVSGTFWQATQPVSGTFWQATQPISGTVTATQGTAAAATAPWPVNYGVPAQVTGSLVNASDVVTASVAGMASIAVKLSIGSSCAGAGCQVIYQASADGGSNYNPVYGYIWKGTATSGGNAYSFTSTFTTATASQTPALAIFSLPAGITHFQVFRSNDGNVGTVSVTIAPGAAPVMPPKIDVGLAAGSNSVGTVTAVQGTANSAANGWPVKWTDGTNVAAVKAASTAAAAADPAGVVGLSPNSPLPTGSNTIGKVQVLGNAGAAVDAANNAAMPANALAAGVQTATIDTSPTAATAGNLRYVLASTEGVTYVQEGGPKRFSCVVPSTTTITTQCQAAPAAGLRAYVTSFTASNAAVTVQSLDVVYGTGTNCVTGTTALTHKVQFGTNATTTSPQSYEMPFPTPLVPVAANAICVRPSAATAFGATLTGYIAP